MNKLLPKRVHNTTIYFMILLVITLGGFVLKTTYAKFISNYTTPDNIVGMSLIFDINISNFEESKEINVAPNSSKSFDVKATNSNSSTAYYGVWYKMINPSEKSNDIVVARNASKSSTGTSGSISANGNVTTTLIIKNNTSNSIKVEIGVASSTTSVNNIEYLNGKKLVTDVVGKKFNLNISNIDEYEEVSVEANSTESFDIKVTNGSSSTAYYGIWYRMIDPTIQSSDIIIAKSVDSKNATSGSITKSNNITVKIVVRNTTNSKIKLEIGVASSTTSVDDIEYLNGKKLITGETEKNPTFNLNLSNIDEYEEVSVAANSAESFHVKVTNSSSSIAYYGVWYKMINPTEKPSNIIIARSSDSSTTTSGSISTEGAITVTIIIKNNTNSKIKLELGIASSTTSVDDIEYLNGKNLITEIAEMNPTFNLNVSNIDEYEELNVAANATESFHVKVANSSSSTAYYGVWYKMINPTEKPSNIIIARSSDSSVTTSGSIATGGNIIVTIIVKNNTSSSIKLELGVASSTTSTNDIEYLNGKNLVSGTTTLES
ncbi:MAG: hypothetical protein SO108_01995 [Bacilli bacterium]|nr:hypothetical protein [Bacilli bacterium]